MKRLNNPLAVPTILAAVSGEPATDTNCAKASLTMKFRFSACSMRLTNFGNPSIAWHIIISG